MNEFRKELEDYFCKFTFGQFVTIILLELVTLFFVFYLGARYGPDLIGDRRSIASVEDQKEVDSPEIDVDLTYPESLPDGGAIRVKPSGISSGEFDAQKRPVATEKRAPVVVPAPERLPTPVAPVVVPEAPPAVVEVSNQYSVQVGAYKNADEAAEQVDKWKVKGYSTFMTVGEIPNKGTWYRVRIGRFSTQNDAKLFLKRFEEKEKARGFVVPLKS